MADVNVFLHEVTDDKNLRTMGKLKENSRDLILKPKEGYYVLEASAANLLTLERVAGQYQFTVSTMNPRRLELKFKDKYEMLQFLISQEGRGIKLLKFGQSQILKKSNEKISNKSLERSDRGCLESKEPEGRADDENNVVDVQKEDVALEYKSVRFSALLEEEIKDLRAELDYKDEEIERQKLQNKKIEKKYFELQTQLEKLVSSHCIHKEQ